MFRFRSLLWRIIGLQILAIAAAAAAVPVATYLLLDATTASFENRTLQAHADSIGAYLSPKGDGRWTLDLPGDLKTFYVHEFGGFAYSVIDREGRVEYSSLPGGGPIMRNVLPGSKPVFFNRKNGKAVYYGASIPQRHGGRQVWVEVAQNLEHPDVIIDDIAAGFLRRVAWFTIPIMLLLLAVDIWIVRSALYPVVRASELARSIDPANLELRLPDEDIPREILPLVQAVNHALARIEKGFSTLRDFTADAAHELRTPLSVLRLRVDTTLAPEAAGPLRKDIDAMSHVVDQLLAVAELESTVVGPDETADLSQVGADVVSLLAPIALRQNKDIALTGTGGPVRVHGNSPMLVQAVRNLAENALAHTPQGTTVEVEVQPCGEIRVLDEGPGVGENEKHVIFRRFWRRERGLEGAGLGLAIVRRIVEAHGGKIEVADRVPRGAIFSMRLRAASSGATEKDPQAPFAGGAA